MIGIKDFLKYVSLCELQVSPDERFAAYAVKQAVLEGNRYSREIWVCELSSGENRKVLADGEITGNFFWDGSEALIYCAADSLCRICLTTGEKTALATLPAGASQTWQLGSSIYFTRMELPAAEAYPEEIAFLADHESGFETATEIPMWDNGRGFVSGKRNALYCLNADGTATRLTGADTTVETVRMEENALVYTARTYRGRTTEPGIYLLRQGGTPEAIVPEGRYRVYQFTLDADGETIWFAGQDKTIHTMTSDPGFYSAKAGRVTKLPITDRSADNSVSIDIEYGGSASFCMADGWIYYTATRDWSSCVERVRPDGSETQVLTPAGGAVSGFSVLGEGKILFVGIRGMELQELWCCTGGALKALTAHNAARLNQDEVIPAQSFSFDQFGFHVNYVVLPPANFDPAKKYPAVLYIHGGAKVLYSTVFFHEMQYLASCGYYVIYGNPHGSDGQGSEFANLLGHYGEKDFADLMKAMDTALELYPNIDPERLGVAGGSYGGIMTNWCVTHTDRFKCGIAQRSICNMMSTFGTADNGFGFVREQMDGDLWDGADKLWRQSPLKYADRCHTPLLLIHSDEDHRCDYSEAVQMFTALRYLGVESKLVLIRGENHGLSRTGRPVQRIKRLYEIRSWLDAHLMPENR